MSEISREQEALSLLNLIVAEAPRDSYIVLSAKVTEPILKWTHMPFKADNLERAARWAIQLCDNRKADVYVRCSVIRNRPGKGRGKKEDTLGTSVLWGDLDGDKGDILDRLEKLPTPSHIQSSGHGIHAFWKLDTFCTEVSILESKNKWIIQTLGGDIADHCWDAARILRVPGTINYKDKSKPVDVKVIISNENTYQINTFGSSSVQAAKNDEPITAEPLPNDFLDNLPPKLAKQIVTGEGGPHKDNGELDRSENDWAICSKLLNRGLRSGQCLTVLLQEDWATGQKTAQQGLAYAISTVIKALSSVPQTLKERTKQAWSSEDFMSVQFPPTKWLVDGAWMENNIGFIAGAPKTMKTWIALDLALSVASGKPFLNHFETQRKGAVIIVQREDPPAYLRDRIIKILNSKGVGAIQKDAEGNETLGFPDVPKFYIWTDSDFFLSDPESQARFHAWIEALNEPRIEMVVLDPLLKMVYGFDEYKATEAMQNVFVPVDSIRQRYNCSVVIVHHASKGEGTSSGIRMYGSMAFHAFSESALYVTREDTEEATVIINTEFKSSVSNPFTINFGDLKDEYLPVVGLNKLTLEGLIRFLKDSSEALAKADIMEHFRCSEKLLDSYIKRAIKAGGVTIVHGAKRKGESDKYIGAD